MDLKKIEKSILEIVEKKKQLSKITYSDESYDRIEEELHDLEDNFTEKFGMFLEKALEEVHEKYCSDNEVLLPIAYLANSYDYIGKDVNGEDIYDVASSQGVFVEVEKMPGVNTKLAIVPGPLRILLLSPTAKELVWKA